MKVYCWKTLLVTILLGGGTFIYKFNDIMTGEVSIYLLIFWGYLIFQGLRVSITREGFEIEQRNKAIYEKVNSKLFGPWALLAPWGGLVLILLAGISIELIPSQKWLSSILFLGGFIYHIVGSSLVRKHIKLEEKNYF